MRDVLFKFLTILLCITLCVNFVRFVIFDPSEDSFAAEPVTVYEILDAVSNIGSDPSIVINSFGQFCGNLAEIVDSFASVFNTSTYRDTGTTLQVLKSFFSVLITMPVRVGITISYTLQFAYSLAWFVNDVIADVFHLLNVILGTHFDYISVTDGPSSGGSSGGGYGGRR